MLLSVPLCLTKKLLNHIILEIAVLSHSCFHVLMKITVRQTFVNLSKFTYFLPTSSVNLSPQ